MKFSPTHLRHFAAPLLSIVVAVLTASDSRATAYTFREFNHPGANENSTSFSSINDAGLIAGYYGSGTPGNEIFTAFTFDGITYSSFSVPGAWGTFARGINSSGIVVGEFGLTGGGGGAFIYDGTSFTTFDHPEANENSTSFSSITDAGLIAGYYGSGTPGNEIFTAFTFDGIAYSTFSVPDAWGTFARDINSDGIVVGEFGLTDGGGGAFIAEIVPEPSTIALVCLGILAILLLKRPKYRLTMR
jgi:hypothetical protein